MRLSEINKQAQQPQQGMRLSEAMGTPRPQQGMRLSQAIAQPINQGADDDGVFKVFSDAVIGGFLNVGKGITGTISAMTGGAILEEATEKIAAAGEDFVPNDDNWLEWGAKIIGGAIPYIGATFTAGVYGGLAAAATVGFMVEGQNAYDDAIARGASKKVAHTERVIVGSINAAIESLQISKLLKFKEGTKHSFKQFIKLAKDRAWKEIGKEAGKFGVDTLKNSISETIEEFIQEGVSVGVPALPFLEGKEALPQTPEGNVDWWAIGERLGGAALAGGVVSPMVGIGGAIVSDQGSLFRPSEENISYAVGRVQKSKLSPAEKEVAINELNNLRIKEDIYTDKLKEVKPIKSPFGDIGYGETINSLPKIPDGYIRLFRGEHSNVRTESTEDDIEFFGREDYGKGGYFTTDLSYALTFYKKYGKNSKLLYMDIPKADADAHFIRNIEFQKDEYFFPELRAVGKSDLSQLTDRLVKDMEEIKEIRPVEAKEMSKKLGERFATFSEIVSDKNLDPTAAFVIAQSSMKGNLKQQITPFLERGYTQEDVDSILNAIRFSNQLEGTKIAGWQAIDKLFNLDRGIIPAKHEIKALEPILGKKFTESALKLYKKSLTPGQKISQATINTLNLPRALLTSYDISGALRQGGKMLFTDAKAWAKGFGTMVGAFMNPEYAEFAEMNIKTHKFYDMLQKSGLELTKTGGGVGAEEAFMSGFAEKIPGISRSERAYTTGLNVMRAQAFYNIAEDWVGTGKTLQDYKDVGQLLNHLTGRGTLGKKGTKWLQKYGPILNAAFFSPKYQIANVQLITDLLPPITRTAEGKLKIDWKGKKPMRKILAWSLAKGLTTGTMILALIKLAYKDNDEVDVEVDPRSSDFGKIRIGNTRIDYWAGYSQMMRLVANLTTGQAKSTGTGRVYDQEARKTVLRYIQTKLSPPAGFAVDFFRGENFMGEQIDWTEKEDIEKQLYEKLVPLFMQDVVDALRYQGVDGAGVVAPSAFFGIGAQTYPVSSSTEAHKYKDHVAAEVFGDKWDNLGADAQKALRDNFPLIELTEAKARQDRRDKSASARFMEEAKKSEKKIRKALKPEIVKQLDLHLVNIGGLSRQLSSDWMLNDKRYKQYHQQTILILNQVLPEIIKLDVPPTAKRELLNDVIARVKKKVRENLVNEGNINDLEKIKKKLNK